MKRGDFRLRFLLVVSELWGTQRLFCRVVWDHSPLTSQRAKGNSYPPLPGPKATAATVRGETESELSLWALMERLNNHCLLHRHHQRTFLKLCVVPSDCTIRDPGQYTKLSLSLISNWSFTVFHFNFLHWFIAWHMNGNSAGPWQTASL